MIISFYQYFFLLNIVSLSSIAGNVSTLEYRNFEMWNVMQSKKAQRCARIGIPTPTCLTALSREAFHNEYARKQKKKVSGKREKERERAQADRFNGRERRRRRRRRRNSEVWLARTRAESERERWKRSIYQPSGRVNGIVADEVEIRFASGVPSLGEAPRYCFNHVQTRINPSTTYIFYNLLSLNLT